MSAYVKSEGGFIDGNNIWVKAWDVVEYRIGARRGILLEAMQDGDATVWFADVQECELVKWNNLCKVPM